MPSTAADQTNQTSARTADQQPGLGPRTKLSDGATRLRAVAPGRGAIRLTRVALFACCAVGLAAGAHLAGGEPIPTRVALASVPAVMMVMNLLAARRRGLLSLLPAMGLIQVGLHLAFMLASSAGNCRAIGGHVMTGASVGMSCHPAMASGGMAGRMWPSPMMLLAHGLATVLVVLLLAHGESAIWALVGALGFRITLPEAGAEIVFGVRRLPVAGLAAFLPRSQVPRRGVRRRGPPRVAAAVT
jgi:hypothetical protein